MTTVIDTAKQPLLLIADDEPANIQILAEVLRHDYRIKVATNGRIALELANRDDRPDLVILDIMMPEMDGFEVCRRLKDNPDTQHIPVMFITSMNGPSIEFESLQLEAMEFISKPVNPLTLRMRVRNLVKLKLLQDKLKNLSTQDALTGISNRRRFDEFLEGEWRRALRAGSPIGLIMLDVDLFKQFNDSYGHVEGDHCLIQVANALVSLMQRPGDLAVRYGGEEFVGILASTEHDDAVAIAELCRSKIESLQIPHDQSPYGVVTVSCGVSMMVPSEASSRLDLVEQADKKLYLAKTSGRNRVVGTF